MFILVIGVVEILIVNDRRKERYSWTKKLLHERTPKCGGQRVEGELLQIL